MKTFPAIYLVLPVLLLSSCFSYQYVSPLPSTPHFTESGEIQGQLAVGRNHYEIQASASFLKNFGAGFTAFNAPSSAIRSYTLHYFRQGKKWPNLYTSAFVGYDKGNLVNDRGYMLFGGFSHREYCTSSYETLRAGGGVYYSPSDERIQIGYFLSFQQIQFYTMDVEYDPINWSPWYVYHLNGTQKYTLASPNLSMTVFSKNRLFYVRNQLLFEIPISDPLNVVYRQNDIYSKPIAAQMKPRMSMACLSISLGMRLVPMHLFRN